MKAFKVSLGLAVVGVIAAGAWWFGFNQGADQAAVATTQATSSTTAATDSSEPSAANSTTTSTTLVGQRVVVRGEPLPPAPAPQASLDPAFEGYGYGVVAVGGADLATRIDAEPYVRAHEGLTMPVLASYGDWVQVMTPCDDVAWVRRGEMSINAHRSASEPGPAFDLASAIIVVDPGHGGENNIGAVGRQGSPEKTINAVIAGRLRDLLESSHLIDWETGDIYTGDAVPAVGAVVMTRTPLVAEGDYEAGLIFRATLANAAGADVLMSIHNNAGHEIDLAAPGSDVFYQSQSVESRRLAELLAEEFQRSFVGFNAAWVGAQFVGAKSRLSPRDGASQYYGILRRSEVPAVIAEGSYLSNPDEEVLLNTARFQQAYAEAAYRAIVRFLTTDDAGGPSTDPEVWEGFAGSGAPATECLVPAQP